MRASLVITILLALAGCTSAPERLLPAPPPLLISAPPVILPGLKLPARLGLLRLVGGQATAIPANEFVRWRGALRQVNHRLLSPVMAVPLAPVGGAPADAAELQRVAAEAARAAGLDAVLIYELAVAVEDDPLPAAIAQLPLLGGIVPTTVTSEAHGASLALLLDAVSGAAIGWAEARLVDRPVATLRQSGGDGSTVQGLADYAALHALIPAAEDMLVEAAAAAIAAAY